MVRQFYATLEVHAEQEKLMWMTATCMLEATFRDLAAVVGLDYRRMKKGKSVASIFRLLVDGIPELYYHEDSMFGPKGGMRRFPKVLHEILRHTIVPSAAIEDGAVGQPALEVISVALAGDELDLLDLLVDQMLECKRNIHAPLALQPYIMALVLYTFEDFYGSMMFSTGLSCRSVMTRLSWRGHIHCNHPGGWLWTLKVRSWFSRVVLPLSRSACFRF